MLSHVRPAIVSLLVLTLITGVVYPLAITGIAAVAFAHERNGSLIHGTDGQPIGSELIGQSFDDPRYFWPRPSATSPIPYSAYNGDKATGSSGSNQGPTSPALLQAVKERVDALKNADAGNQLPIPVDLVTASASGLDPHISLAAAGYQVPRVARVRGMTEDDVRQRVRQFTEGRTLGVLGEPRVNVLKLNLALDSQWPGPLAPASTRAATEHP